jgi:UDP:flavonoid glycosyltransferase YjiC (YdhE family)
MGRVNGRIMVVTTGSFVDVNPFVGLALELQARGHRPVIVSAPFWRQWIEEAGVEYETFESGWDIPPENPAQCLDPTALAKPASESYRELALRVRGSSGSKAPARTDQG